MTKPLRWLLRLYDAGLLILLLLVPIIWIRGHLDFAVGNGRIGVHWGLRPLFAFLIVVIARILTALLCRRAGMEAAGLWRTRPFPQVVMSLLSTFAFFGAFESMLALRGYTADLPPVVFEGRDDAGGIIIEDTLPDPELLWKFKPGGSFHGRRINAIGFREREVDPVKAPGVRRVICMGDSVTGQGRPGYAEYLDRKLKAQPPTPGLWEAFNVGVHGYCTLQGLRQFDRLARQLDPDVVTIYFGWNDHWLASQPFSKQMAVRMNSTSGRLYEMLKKKRFFMFLVASRNPVRPLAHKDSAERMPRVPPAEYTWALGALIDKVRASGAVPLVITAARSDLTEELTGKGYAHTVAEAEKTHDEYVELTRAIARERGAAVLDLAAILQGPGNKSLFARDGIHFDFYSEEGRMTEDPPAQPGLERIADELHRKLIELAARGELR